MKKKSISVKEDKVLISQWDWKSNDGLKLDPGKISIGSHKKAFWNCEKHNSVFMQVIRDRKKEKIGCRLCKQEQLNQTDRERYMKGKKPLSQSHPELVKQWVACVDSSITPDTCSAGSSKSVLWKCPKCGGEYEAIISNRTRMNSGCPYCSGQKVLEGFNDFKTLQPGIAKEWSEKNKLLPSEVTVKSNKKVYWKCHIGHNDYLMSVKNRVNGQGCPICSKESQTSFPEQAIFYYVKQLFKDANNRFDELGFEIDIYIPSIKTGIEYNGIYYHKNKKDYDALKKDEANKEGIKLITIEEIDIKNDKNKLKSSNRYEFCWNYSIDSMSKMIKELLEYISPNNNITIDLNKDRIAIDEQYITGIKKNSIIEKCPQIAAEWDYTKNGAIKPEYISYGSHKKYYWQCSKCGYSFMTSPRDRVRGKGCPCCSGKIIVEGVNDLKTKCPEIAKEWCYSKNGNLKPEEFTFGSSKNVWWECVNGHYWKRKINGRTSHNNGCPYCSGRIAIKGVNDIETTNPKLLEEWDYKKNNIKPDEIKVGSNKTVWWKCKEGHSYKKRIADRAKGRGCPYCSNHKVLEGFNDLATTNPKLAKEWNYEKNYNLTPKDVIQGTHKKVWWKCNKCGNEWNVSVANRNCKTGCPKCHHKYWK